MPAFSDPLIGSAQLVGPPVHVAPEVMFPKNDLAANLID
jgi:hypothetical protein